MDNDLNYNFLWRVLVDYKFMSNSHKIVWKLEHHHNKDVPKIAIQL